MSAKCLSLEELMQPREQSVSTHQETIPSWLRTKPKKGSYQERQALEYCRERGISTNPPPWIQKDVR